MENGAREITISTQINGEANLDVLKGRITIPAITVPFVGMKTPRMEDYSLWEDTGMSYLLITTQQTLDMSHKLTYTKNPQMYTININMGPLVNAINTYTKTMHKNMLISKDKAAAMLATSFDKAKAEYEKYSIEMPKTVTVPAYKVPVLNVEMSTFTIPLPDFTLIQMPAMHVPSALSKLTLPKITLPKVTNIKIPLMGDLTSEFTVKTAMITLKTDASILKQDGFVVKLDASSTSEFEMLNGKIEGHVNVNTDGRFELGTLLSVKHAMVEGKHEGNTIVGYVVTTSITNSAKINLPFQTMEAVMEIHRDPQQGFLVSVSNPSAGYMAFKMQTKYPAEMEARLYGRYPSELETAVDILGLKMSVKNSENLNIQTTWNMEIPNEIMLQLKEQVPSAMELVTDPAVRTFNTIYRHARSLEGPFEQAREQGKVIFKSAVDNVAAMNPSGVMKTVTDETTRFLREYQKKVEIVFNAVVKFLRETKFQIPGYEQRMSGLEVCQKISYFVADVSEEALQKIPEFFSSMFKEVLDNFNAMEFVLPGSNHAVSGREILDDLFVALRKIQNQVVVTVRRLGNVQLEDIIDKLSKFMQFTFEKSEMFLQTLKSQNGARIYNFAYDLYDEVVNSPVMFYVTKQLKESYRVVMEYLKAVTDKLRRISSDISREQLQSEIQTWIVLTVNRVNAFQNNVMRMLKDQLKAAEPFVTVGDRQIEIDIPLPFVAKFN